MRKFNMLVAGSAALLIAGAVSAKEQPAQPKPRKVCRTEQMSGRITPQRICRVVAPRDSAADGQRRPVEPREPGSGRD